MGSRTIITPETEFMPCCQAVIDQQPSPVRMTGTAFIPETLWCDCGAEWRILEGAKFDHLDPNGVTVERVDLDNTHTMVVPISFVESVLYSGSFEGEDLDRLHAEAERLLNRDGATGGSSS